MVEKVHSGIALNVGMDSAILMNPQTWVASGHLSNFDDPLMDCKACKARFRADKLIEDFFTAKGESVSCDGWSNEQMETFIKENNIVCPSNMGRIRSLEQL